MKTKRNIEIKLGGGICKKCGQVCVVKKWKKPPVKRNYYFTQWDYCLKCKTVWFDEKYKSQDWQENERQQDFFRSLR